MSSPIPEQEALRLLLEKLSLSTKWPSADDLNCLTNFVAALYKRMGHKRPRFGRTGKMYVSVDKRFQKLGLMREIEELLARLIGVANSPVCKIHRFLFKKDGKLLEQEKRSLEEMLQALLRQERASLKLVKTWTPVWSALSDILSPEFNQAIAKGASENEFEFKGIRGRFIGPLMLAAYADALNSQLNWSTTYAEHIDASLSFFYLLQLKPYWDQIAERYSGDTPSIAEMMVQVKKSDDRIRQERSRSRRTARQSA